MSKDLLPIGFVGYTKKQNIQNLRWNTGIALFIITGYNDNGKGLYPYCVKFIDNKFKELNEAGPFLSRHCISKRKINKETVRILYGH